MVSHSQQQSLPLELNLGVSRFICLPQSCHPVSLPVMVYSPRKRDGRRYFFSQQMPQYE